MAQGGSSKKAVRDEIEKGMKIWSVLVVDDDPMVRRIHGMMVAKYGMKSEVAENGKVAVDLFESGKRFDLVLMDMEMPVMDGAAATRMLRGMGVRCMIVGVTARCLEAEKAAFMEAGLDSCLEKPLKPQALISIIHHLSNK